MCCVRHGEGLFPLLLSGDLDRLGVRNRYTVDGLVNGLPGVGIGVQTDIEGSRGQLPAVGCDAADIDAPLLAVPGPEAVAEPAIGLEHPGANPARSIVL